MAQTKIALVVKSLGNGFFDAANKGAQEAAKALYAGVRAGIPVTRDQALRWITANPAWASRMPISRAIR